MTHSPKWNWPDPSTTHLEWCRSRSAHVPKLRSLHSQSKSHWLAHITTAYFGRTAWYKEESPLAGVVHWFVAQGIHTPVEIHNVPNQLCHSTVVACVYERDVWCNGEGCNAWWCRSNHLFERGSSRLSEYESYTAQHGKTNFKPEQWEGGHYKKIGGLRALLISLV